MSVSPQPTPPGTSQPKAEFDAFAEDYDAALNKGISVSGEDKRYFIAGRVGFTARCVAAGKLIPEKPAVMDFGCGTGDTFPELRRHLSPGRIVGVDVSEAELAIARRDYAGNDATLYTPETYVADGSLDLIYSNGTFHHIPPDQRAGVVAFLYRSLRPGGVFALWENNPWNPGTRIVMKRIPFDRDAITLSPPETRRMLRAGGFEPLRSDFLFYFPRMLSVLRFIEPAFRKVPLGAQYLTLSRRPAGG